MKFRIIKKSINDEVTYYPQRKCLWWWYFTKYEALDHYDGRYIRIGFKHPDLAKEFLRKEYPIIQEKVVWSSE